MNEVDQFLELTDSSLTIDLFCFDPQLHVHKEFVPVKVEEFYFIRVIISFKIINICTCPSVFIKDLIVEW
jgi:hypothetical protein